MKILAQSKISSKPPYLHLAYTAATAKMPNGTIFSIAFLMLIIALVINFRTLKKKTKKGIIETHIVLRKMAFKKRIYRVILLVLAISLLYLSFVYGTNYYTHPKTLAKHNIMFLTQDLLAYPNTHDGKLPQITNWCDELLETSERGIKAFQHPGSGPNRTKDNEKKTSDYAINANISSLNYEDLSPDVVILFEAREGWNLAGGSELTYTGLGDKSGCYITFASGNIKFIKTKDIPYLNWHIKDE